MCFQYESGDIESTATQDIECYKKMFLVKQEDGSCKIKSSLYDYNLSTDEYVYYDLNKEYCATNKLGHKIDKLKITGSGTIEEGFHSYRELWSGSLMMGGLHKLSQFNLQAIRCIIPIGAKYYKNENEYVSDRIKFVEIMEL